MGAPKGKPHRKFTQAEKLALHHIGIDVVIDMQRCIRAKHWTRRANCSFGWQSWRQM